MSPRLSIAGSAPPRLESEPEVPQLGRSFCNLASPLCHDHKSIAGRQHTREILCIQPRAVAFGIFQVIGINTTPVAGNGTRDFFYNYVTWYVQILKHCFSPHLEVAADRMKRITNGDGNSAYQVLFPIRTGFYDVFENQSRFPIIYYRISRAPNLKMCK